MSEGYREITWAIFALGFHGAGILSAIHAVLTRRTSQSAIAWSISCVTFPYVAVPAYWILGQRRFHGYIVARRTSNSELHGILNEIRRNAPGPGGVSPQFFQSAQVFEHLAGMPFSRGNRVELLIDGNAFFDAAFERIAGARDYILVQFFIVRSDELGQRFRDALAEKVRQGVRVHFLYDQIGSHQLDKAYVNSLRDLGIQIQAFKTVRGQAHRFQINFRNHRKMVLVDGRWAATGGVNLGQEYCGRSEQFGYWRDTMVAVAGPVVQEIQLCFVQDWFYLTRDMPPLNWESEPVVDDQALLVMPTGPADELHACSMMFTQAIHSAEERLWVTTPYFVPDSEIIRALQLAALRGVDVRILMPENPDHRVVNWASFTYLEELENTGVRFFRYQPGILHEKVMLIDDRVALVGSANMDNRSFYLNFEMTLIVADIRFAADIESMLEKDFAASRPTGYAEYLDKGIAFKVLTRVSRLFAPVL